MSESPQDPQTEEFAYEDDAIIGRALRNSLIVLVVIGAAVGGFFLLNSDDEKLTEVKPKDVGEIADLTPELETLPTVRFTDVTRAAGIDYVHENGAAGEKLLPETMGGGAAFFDYDNDGDPDLLFVDGARWDAPEGSGGHRLYRNDGKGSFEDVTSESGLTGGGFGMGVAVGDYDGDGWTDVFTTGVGVVRLHRNEQGEFRDVTSEAGIPDGAGRWSTSAGFFDYDDDGDLDLFVCHYVEWSKEIDERLAFTMNGVDRAYGPPTNYGGSFSQLLRNEGNGKFTDVSESAGIEVKNSATGAPMGKVLGVAFADFDQDGRVDIAVANDTVQNHLFHNRGDGTFEEVGVRSGFGFDSNGRSTGAMGINVADMRGDGDFAVCIGNFANEMSSLYVARRGSLRFNDDAMGEGVGSPSRQKLSFGMFFFDYDLDGRLDLLQVNGHLEETIHEVQPSQHYRQAPQLFWNAGPEARACYTEVPSDQVGDLGRELVGRGSAYADIDADGDLDVVIAQVGDAPVLLRNDQETGHRWLRVRVVRGAGAKTVIGAWVHLGVGGETLRRQVMPTRSYLSQSELPVTFGVGANEKLDFLRVLWPDGTTTEVDVPDGVNREVVVERKP